VILVCLGRRDPRRDVEKTRASHCFSALVSAKLRKSFPVHLINEKAKEETQPFIYGCVSSFAFWGE